MKEVARMIVSAAAAALAFLLLFLGLHWPVILCAALCVGLYLALDLLLRPRRKIGGMDVEKMKGGEELRQLLEEARNDLKTIRQAAAEIQRPDVRRDAETLYQTGTRMVAYLEEHPEKIPLARRFFTYYLDTAAALLSRCQELQQTGLQTLEVREILERTAKALPVLIEAFERQFTHLMEGELMNLEADVELLESTLKMEGGK